MRIEERNGKSMDEKLTVWKNPIGKKEKRRIGFGFHKFLRQNPEIVFRVMLAICSVAIFAACMMTRHNTVERLEAQHSREIQAVKIQVEQETLARVKEQYGINAANQEKAVMEEEAKTVAKILYAMRNNRVEGLHLACWSVFDRVDHVRYADDVYSVCSADQAYMGWSDSNPVLDDLYKIALEEVQRWHTGVRPLDSAFVYLYWSPSEIYLFDDSGHKFFESDWMKYMDTLKSA